MAFDKKNLDDYVEVSERIAGFRSRYPTGALQSRVIQLPDAFAGQFIAVEAKAYRSPEDTMPGVGLAWEPVPGQTPYTKNSELQNAESSAWGRALIAVLDADSKRGIASAQEVRNRKLPADAPSPLSGVAGPQAGREATAITSPAEPSRPATTPDVAWKRYEAAQAALQSHLKLHSLAQVRLTYVKPFCVTNGWDYPPTSGWPAEDIEAIAVMLERRLAVEAHSTAEAS